MLIDLFAEHKVLIGWLGLISIFTFLLSLLIIPWLILRIPVDYFHHEKRYSIHSQSPHPTLRRTLTLFKNLLGCLFILAGFGMLFLPGQGILTMLIGMMMTNFPGKYRLEKKLVCKRSVHRAINWIRTAGKKPPLMVNPKGGIDECQDPDQTADFPG